jgi:hypothetical protein
MTKKQHTAPAILALPYELSDMGIIYGAPKADDSSTFVADLELEESSEEQVAAERARGEFIVKACNAHYDLMTSLKDVLSRFVDCIGIGGEIEGDREAIAKARAAIAKAAGGVV